MIVIKFKSLSSEVLSLFNFHCDFVKLSFFFEPTRCQFILKPPIECLAAGVKVFRKLPFWLIGFATHLTWIAGIEMFSEVKTNLVSAFKVVVVGILQREGNS